MAFVAISFAGFSNEEAGTIKKSTKNNKEKIVKKIKAINNIKAEKRMDCYAVQMNTSCGTFNETMCSEGGTPRQRQEAFEVLTEMYDNAVCE